MKNILFVVLFILGICSAGYSQSLALSDSTGPLTNNATVTRQGHVNDDEIVSYIFVRNTTAAPIDVLVRKVEISVVAGSVNTFCWGLCFPPDTYVSPNPLNLHAMTTDSINFSGHFNPTGFAGVSEIRYVFYNRLNPSDSVCVNISYNVLYVGINNPVVQNTLSGAYPNPANNTVNFEYSLNTGNTGNVIIRNLLGSVVKKSVFNGSEGKLAVYTGDLPEGIYFYSLDVDGKTMTTRKLIVRH
jgi:hypothetical protein